MKKILIFCLLLILVNTISIKAYTKTGHEMFTEIEFVEEGTLLVNMTSKQIDQGYKDIGRGRFVGWKHHFFTVKKEATYIGEILFARSNRSREPIKIDYKLKDTQTNERSYTIGGSLSSKFKTNIKSIDMELSPKIDGSIRDLTSNQKVEETSFTVTVMPNYKVVFRETGEALVTNGVSKFYILGITFNKGQWEYIDVVTRYYELYEEEL